MNMQSEAVGPSRSATIWRPLHAYLMAVICLVIGVAIGYLVRGSAPPKTPTMATAMPESAPAMSSTPTAGAVSASTPTLDDMKRMAEKQAKPLLTELETKPNDAVLLNKAALTYKAAHQFDKAAEYFKKSLDSDPKNVAVRDDYASCLYYLGNVDGALAQLNKSLTYDPKHPGTLYNIGMIEWKGKGDTNAAVAAWEKMLKLNPSLPQKEQIQHMIEMVKQNKSTVTEKE